MRTNERVPVAVVAYQALRDYTLSQELVRAGLRLVSSTDLELSTTLSRT